MAKKKANEEAKNEGLEKANGDKKDSPKQNDESKKKKEAPKEPSPVIFKTDIHCQGCASKLTKLARSFPDAQSANAEMLSGKVTVFGPVDPLQLLDFIAQKTRKKIELVSPVITKAEKSRKNDEKNDENKHTEGKTEKNQKAKEAPLVLTTSVIKMNLHCQGCIEKIYKIASKTKGVLDVSVDKQKETVTVKGTMNAAALADTLKERLKRNAELVPSKDKEKEEVKEKKKKVEDNGGGDKKKAGDNSGGGKKEKRNDGGETATVPENRIDLMAGGFGYSGHGGVAGVFGHRGYSDGPSVYGPQCFPPQPPPGSYFEPGQTVWFGQNGGAESGYSYPNAGYPPHMKFNDENPNACSVM